MLTMSGVVQRPRRAQRPTVSEEQQFVGVMSALYEFGLTIKLMLRLQSCMVVPEPAQAQWRQRVRHARQWAQWDGDVEVRACDWQQFGAIEALRELTAEALKADVSPPFGSQRHPVGASAAPWRKPRSQPQQAASEKRTKSSKQTQLKCCRQAQRNW